MIKQLTIAAALLLTLAGEVSAQLCAVGSAPPQSPPQNQPPTVCQPKTCGKCTQSPCYIAFGNYTTDNVDLNIRTTGFPLLVTRNYDSSRMVDGPSGIGWFSSMTPRLYYATYLFSAPSTYSHEADINMPDGTQLRFTANADGTFTAPGGRYDTLVKNADGTFTLTLQRSWSKLQFRADGALTSMSDDFGNSINYTYDASGRTQRVADAAGSGRYLDVTWDSATGRISMITDSTGRHVNYTYNADGTLKNVADPMASQNSTTSTNYTYVPGRFVPLLSSITDRWNRLISQLTWDASDRLKSYTDGTYVDGNPGASPGEKYSYTYYPNGIPGDSRPFTTKSHSLGSTNYYYSFNGLVNANVTYDGAGQPSRSTDDYGSTDYSYALYGLLFSKTRGGVTWKYTYDPTFPTRVSTVIPYDAQTQVRSTKWQGTKYEYAALGPNGAAVLTFVRRYRNDNTTLDFVASYQYDSAGRVTYTTDENGVITVNTYNAAGDRTRIDVLGGTSTDYQFDALGRPTAVIDALGRSTAIGYDANDRVTTITVPPPAAGSPSFVTTYSYDAYDAATGLVFATQTDPNGRTTRHGYDALGHIRRTIDALGNVTLYGYQYDLLKDVTDANGNVTTYGYDGHRHLQSTTFPDGAVESQSIGAYGAFFGKTTRRGITTSYGYDTLGRLTSRNAGGVIDSFQYDGQNLVAATDRRDGSAMSYQFTYDSSFRLLTEGRFGEETITYSYGSGGLVRSYTVTPPSGTTGPTQTVTYTRDAAGRIGGIDWTATPGGGFGISYTATGRYSTITFPNGQTRTFTYDQQDRLLTVSNSHPSTGELATFSYGYDQDYSGNFGTMRGQLTSVWATAPAAAGQTIGQTRYWYDGDYQLSRAEYPTGFDGFTYDAIGNRVTRTTGPATLTYTYYKNGTNPNNGRLLRTDGAGGGDYLYDADGNLVGKNSPGGYVWDNFNRLVNANGIVYGYDYAGRRAFVNNGFSPTNYVHVGLRTVRERNRSTGATTDYIFGPGMDEPLAKRAPDGTITYYSIDGLGSVVAWNNAAGNVTGGVGYGPWGEPRGTPFELFGYTGQETASGELWYYKARYYQWSVGRFVSEDPLRGLGTGSLPEYAYVSNDPLTYSDPFGYYSVSYRKVRDHPIAPNARALSAICRGQNSCTNFLGVATDCSCAECIADEYHPTIIVVIDYEMFLSYGGPAGDPTNEHHENIHMDDVREAVGKYLDKLEQTAYVDQQDCLHACQSIAKTMRNYVQQQAQNSQNQRH